MADYQYRAEDDQELYDNDEEVESDALDVIYRQCSWKVCQVSPLHNLKYTHAKIKQYASKIQQYLTSTMNRKEPLKYNVILNVDENLKGCDSDPYALMITVEATNVTTNKIKEYFQAILMAWEQSAVVPNATHLPYYLHRGQPALGQCVNIALNKIFDCNITPLNFTQSQLLLFSMVFSESEPGNSQKQMNYSFVLTEAALPVKISVSFQIVDILTIWKRICEKYQDEDKSNLQLALQAFKCLQSELFHVFQIDVAQLELVEISCPKACVKQSGAVRVKDSHTVTRMFQVLNDFLPVYME